MGVPTLGPSARPTAASQPIRVDVVYALHDRQKIVHLELAQAATVEAVIERSGLLRQFPEIDLSKNKVGIWNKLVKLDTLVRDHDRVEIYRPLLADPKEVRRQRAAEGKAMKKGGGDLAAA